VAIDDVHWLDRSSATVLDFAIRRLGARRVGLLASVRTVAGTRFAVATEAALGAGRTQRLAVGPLNLGGVHELLVRRLGTAFDRPTLVRILETSGGNPFFALEIGAALVRTGAASIPRERLPVPGSLRELVAGRITSLPPATQEMLLVAAATSAPNVRLVAAVADADPARLDPAIEEGLIEIAPDGVIRFAHPLIASTIYQAAPSARRREVHTRLAGALADLEERARHRALACLGPNPTVAADLAEAARLAHQRGASDTAAELCDRALALCPPGDQEVLVDLRLQAAEYHFVSGDLTGARRLLDEVVRTEAPGPRRAGALRQAAEVCFAGNQYGEAKAMLEQAWGEAADDPGELAMIECGLALATEIVGEIHEAAEHGHSAVIQAERAGIGGVLAEALTMSVAMDLYVGRGLDEGRLCRALELEDPDRRTMPLARPSVGAAVCYVLAGRVNEGYSQFCAVRSGMLERGEEGNLPYIEWWAAAMACHLGRPGEAERIVESLSARARILDAEIPRAFALSASALLHAYRGNVDQAICEAEQALTLMLANGFGNGAGFPLNAIGFAAASVGDWKLVDYRLSSLSQQLYLSGELGEPMVAFQSLPDHVEALIALDQADRAVPLIDWLDERGRAVGRTWAIATAARLRGSLLAAHGDLDAAAGEAAQAVN
jgi:tetratricopeptide (TPR) repeat protein